VPAVNYNSAPKVDVIKFGEAVSAEQLKYPGFLKRGLALTRAADENNLSPTIKQLEQLVSDLNASDGVLLSLLREAKLIKTQLGFTPPQLAQIETSRADIARAIAIFEKAIKGFKEVVAESSA
jgi:septal ring factor EnvC (AmiA/AmiB activator)